MNDRLRYSAVIVTYNRLELLKECLEHCLKQSVPFKEIVVVDNLCTDGSGTYLDELSSREDTLHVYHEEENLGGAGGFYEAMKLVDMDTDYILIMDDDAIIDYDYIKNIEPYMTDDILAYSGKVYDPDMSVSAHRHMLKTRTFLFVRPVDNSKYDLPYFDYEISSFCGLLVSARLVSELGLPKKEYFIWYDDIEYSLRIHQRSLMRNVNSAFLIHKTKSFGSCRISWRTYYGDRNSWDMARRFSSHPRIYDAARIVFHCGWIIIHTIKAISPADRKYNLDAAKLHRDVLRFLSDNKLGFNPEYGPLTKIGE